MHGGCGQRTPTSTRSLADRVEAELGLTKVDLPGEALGSIDTFRFEERALLRHCGELIATGRLRRGPCCDRRARAQLLARPRRGPQGPLGGLPPDGRAGRRGRQVQAAADQGAAATPGRWVDAYSAVGWHRLDQAQRRLEAWVANLDEEPEERPLGVVRRAYEEACGGDG